MKKQMDLFGDKQSEVIRTLGFYEPFGSLMLHGKIETRWVREGRKPPFPLGRYLFYTTKEPCDPTDQRDWCGEYLMMRITKTLVKQGGFNNGMALGIGELVEIRLLTPEDEEQAFVKYVGRKVFTIKGEDVHKIQWALVFKDVKRIESFKWEYGKQGTGFVPDEIIPLIKYK